MNGAASFDREGWWDDQCRAFRSLRSITTFRLELLRAWLPGPWSERTVVDLGCGGGLLAVPLAEAGARVLGVDVGRRALAAAAARCAPRLLPVAGDLFAPPVANGAADVVLLADVIEHVDDPARAVASAAALLAPGGHLFVNTIDRSLRSAVVAIGIAEGLGLVPRGTHAWRGFVRPHELDRAAVAAGLCLVRRTGESARLFATLRARAIVLRESASTAIGYASLYRRGA